MHNKKHPYVSNKVPVCFAQSTRMFSVKHTSVFKNGLKHACGLFLFLLVLSQFNI